MQCPPGNVCFQPQYVAGPIRNTFVANSWMLKKKWKQERLAKTRGKISTLVDWAIGKCNDESDDYYNYFAHYPRYNPRVHNQAKSSTAKKKPLMILVLTIDSFSRRHFFRKLPQTVKFLNDLRQQQQYAVFDFKLHNIIGSNTAENISRLFAGKQNTYSEEIRNDKMGSSSMWRILKELGFATLLGFDGCANNVFEILGKSPKVDHVVNSFYCALYRFS